MAPLAQRKKANGLRRDTMKRAGSVPPQLLLARTRNRVLLALRSSPPAKGDPAELSSPRLSFCWNQRDQQPSLPTSCSLSPDRDPHRGHGEQHLLQQNRQGREKRWARRTRLRVHVPFLLQANAFCTLHHVPTKTRSPLFF